jgi:hypothetical protein
MRTVNNNSKRNMRLKPRIKHNLSQRIIKTGAAFLVCFGALYFYFNLGRNTDSRAAGNTMEVVQDGNWNSTSTWSLGRLPMSNDTLVVPAGMTLTVNLVTQSYEHMYIKVFGTIYFNGGKKIVMCDGQVRVYSGGLLDGENTGSKIDICNTMVWDGNDPGDGPLYFSGNALPIDLMSFDAKPSGNEIQFEWTTGGEINNDYFTIERSSDGNNFLPIKKTKGAGNSTSILHYTSSDEKPMQGVNYYRLKQTDYDGKFTYSKVRNVRFDNSIPDKAIVIESIAPNPFMEDFTLNYTSAEAGNATVLLLNASGSIVGKENLQAVKGTNSFRFTETMNLSKGIYYLRLMMNDEVVTNKIIKN